MDLLLVKSLPFEQLHHRLTHSQADVHVSLRVAVVVAVGSASLTEGMGVNGGDVPLEFRVLAGCSSHGELGIKDQLLVLFGAIFRGLTEGGDDELGVRGFKFLAQSLNEVTRFFS